MKSPFLKRVDLHRLIRAYALLGVFCTPPFCGDAWSQMNQEEAMPDTRADSAQPGLRQENNMVLSLEAAWNGLVGVGPLVHIYVQERYAIDIGFGLASGGIQPGARLRYLFRTGGFAPFAGLGFAYALGTGGKFVKVETPDEKKKVDLLVEALPKLQLVGGGEYMMSSGWLFTGSLGWMQVLKGKPYRIAEEDQWLLTEKDKQVYDIALGSGVVLSMGVGISF